MKTGVLSCAIAIGCLLATGCSTNKEWGKGTAMGAAIGGAVGGGAGVGVQYGRDRDDAADLGAGAAVGVGVGMLVGGLVGHYLWDEEKPAVERAPEAEPAPEEAAKVPEMPPPSSDRIILRGVLFEFDSAAIKPEASEVLADLVVQLRAKPDVAIVIEGFTDSVGAAEYNVELGLRRAEAVRQYLVAQGIDAARLSVKSFGAENPVASNDTSEGRAQNRRVEFQLRNGH